MGKPDTDDTQMAQRGPDWEPGRDKERSEGEEKDAMKQGDRTRPVQPDGTTPLERDLPPINQKR